MPCAIEAVASGARVLVVEQAERPGGTLHVSLGQLSGAGTRLQRERGIEDSVDEHLRDIDRISRGTARREILKRTVPNQGATIDWLMDNGFEMAPECPAILHLHEAYGIARTYWGIDGGLSVLKTVIPLFDEAIGRPNAEILYRHRAVSLITEDLGVVGVRIADVETGAEQEVNAKAVVLASGGYGANAALFARLTNGRPLVTAAMPTSTGSGLEMAEDIGAEIVGAELFLPTYAGVVSEPDGSRIVWRQMPSLTPQVRQPWELHLAPDGSRFVREDDPSVDAREHALNAIHDLTFWCVFDEAILAKAPPLLPGWSDAELEAAWSTHPSFVSAASLDELAAKTGMSPDEARQSISVYNAAAEGRAADPTGRVHCPQPITGPAFRAIRMHGIILKTPAGLSVDDQLRVRRADGRAIDGLYAVGEAIGGSTLSGRGFVSGMSVTPALTLGRWLGQSLGSRFRAEEAR